MTSSATFREDDAIPNFVGVRNFADIHERFIESARSIMLKHRIFFEGRYFDITSMELYLKLHDQRNIWWDATTDKDAEEQFNRSTWYVRQKKGPAFWRIDLTAGCKTAGIQAGLLIRQVDRDGGPAKALHTFIRGGFGRHRWTDEERERVEKIHGKLIDGSNGSPLMLVRRTDPVPGSLWKGTRIGLSKRNLDAKNFEGISINNAPLRVSTWKMRPRDEMVS